jgi:hypothetical protein
MAPGEMAAVPVRARGDDLCHLHPVTVSYAQEAKGDKPARCYTVDIIFSLHCFTPGDRRR